MGTKVKNDLADIVLGADEVSAEAPAEPTPAEAPAEPAFMEVTAFEPEQAVEVVPTLSAQTLLEIEEGKAALLRKQNRG